MAAPTILKIGGVTMPVPAVGGITYTHEPIWSQDAGRASSTQMKGRTLGYKWKLVVKWPPLTLAKARLIHDNVSKGSADFKTVEFINPLTDSTETITAYCGTVGFTLYTTTGPGSVRDMTVDIIER